MNANLVYVLGGMAAVGVFLLFVLLRGLWGMSTHRASLRLKDIESEGETGILRRPRPTNWPSRLDQAFEDLILRTGLDLRPDQALAWMILAGGVLAVGAFFLKDELWFCTAAFFLGATAVLIIFFVYRANYLNKIQDQLADAIYLLARSLRAGLSLEQSLELIGNEGVKPLATEFKRCHAQIKLGLPIHVAMENAAQQLQMLDFNALVSTVTVFQATGGNLPLLLDRLAASARDRASLRAYFRSATAMARVAIIPIGLAVPAILLTYIIWEPTYVQAFLETTNGRIMIVAGVAMEVIGFFWIRHLLSFEY